ncbi:arginase family protein [Yinghuangia seranimata]|uniref:arginase family protein n=1 Tax=Yinghuangia seranimata TaxID=408067 RepID=UPI00248D360D|nr:arginase family protein [Yinghuangia seranimata]MDI2129784.1 arginase family protein [Yinghuangia seranimata]
MATRSSPAPQSDVPGPVLDTGWFLLGAPWDCSGTGRGEQLAPAALRDAGLAAWTGAAGHDAGDAMTDIRTTDRDPASGVRALDDTVRAAANLADALRAARRAHPGRRPLVLGGDCSLLLGVFAALDAGTGLWFVDGHPDYVDGTTSDTGETADMDLAALTGAAELPGLFGESGPPVRPEDVVLLGHRVRGIDAAAAAETARLPDRLRRHDADAVRADPSACGRDAEARLRDVEVGVWLHLDADVLDPTALPAVTYPQPDGPDWTQITELLRPLGHSPALIGMSIADYRPDLDPSGEGARRLVALLAEVLPGPTPG